MGMGQEVQEHKDGSVVNPWPPERDTTQGTEIQDVLLCPLPRHPELDH